MKVTYKFEDTLAYMIVIFTYIFLGYAYYVTTDATIRGVILTAVIANAGLVLNWRYSSSKSSANKDATIQSMQETIKNQPTTIAAKTATVENAEVLNSEKTIVTQKPE